MLLIAYRVLKPHPGFLCVRKIIRSKYKQKDSKQNILT